MTDTPTQPEPMTLDAFVSTHGLGMTVSPTDHNPFMEDKGRAMDHWQCVLICGKRRFSVVFSMGSGHLGKEPTIAEVLDCLASDAGSIDQSFEDWAKDLGMDTDSRMAERTYNACVKSSKGLRRLLGDVAYEQITSGAVERL